MNNALNILASELGEGFTVGYIGNVDRHRDDRSWRFFAPHPGRVGEWFDMWGSASTPEELIIKANRNNEGLKRWAAIRTAAGFKATA